jgi:uncharacterized membrane protein SpoIIM required for sporulation
MEGVWVYVLLLVIAFLISIISGIGTLMVGKEVNQKMKKYKKDTTEAIISRSKDYEAKSVKTHASVLVVVWGFTILVCVVGTFFFLLFSK